VNGTKLIRSGGKPELSRAQIDNERRQRPHPNAAWDTVAEKAVLKSITATPVGGAAKIVVRKNLPNVRGGFATVYTVQPSCEIIVEVAYDFNNTPNAMRPPLRVGIEWIVPAAFENIAWFGRDGETYAGRDFNPVGIFKGTVDGQWTDYSRPQENGNKTAVRWVALTDSSGTGLLVVAEGAPLGIGARHYSQETMRKSDYSFQMERSDDIFLNIDTAQSGVGGINSWGQKPLHKYRLFEKTYRYSYRLLPLAGNIKDTLRKRAAFTPSPLEKLATF
jgi:beta-galactosidase